MAVFRALPERVALPLVVVPEPFPDASGRRVLVMEYLDGVPIDDVQATEGLGHNGPELIDQVVRGWLVTALRGISVGPVSKSARAWSKVAAVGPIVVAQMKGAADLVVPLEVEMGEGATWADAH